MATKKKLPDKKDTVDENKNDKIIKRELFEKIFFQGERIGFNKKQTLNFLIKNKLYYQEGSKIGNTVKSLQDALTIIMIQRSLEEYSFDDLVMWRNAAHDRIEKGKKTINHFEKAIIGCIKVILCKKKKINSDSEWRDKLNKAISKKMKNL